MDLSTEDMKNYLRVDFSEDDSLITTLIVQAKQLVLDILRMDSFEEVTDQTCARIAVMYAVAYLYEHREEADYHDLALTLRSILFGSRKAGF